MNLENQDVPVAWDTQLVPWRKEEEEMTQHVQHVLNLIHIVTALLALVVWWLNLNKV